MRRYNGRCAPEQKVMRPDLLTLASNLAAREERFALVTVVRREPPSSARVGDVAVVTEGGDYYGWVGGGCTRSTVLREARCAIDDGAPRTCSSPPWASAIWRRSKRSLAARPRISASSQAPSGLRSFAMRCLPAGFRARRWSGFPRPRVWTSARARRRRLP